MSEVQVNGWIARDSGGMVSFHHSKPFSACCGLVWESDSESISLPPDNGFDYITWENSPQKVELVIRKVI